MNSDSIKVLLIEDDEDDYILTRDLLSQVQSTSYALDWASSYKEGLEILKRGEHDVCLVDYRLGELSGVQLIREGRDSQLVTPMILLTGQSGDDVDLEAIDAGAMGYLVKDESPSARMARTIRCAVARNSERSIADDILANRTAELQVVNRELEAFAYSVSHDLRAPLRHINGFSQALLEDCGEQLDARGRGYLQQVRTATKEMAQLIDDLLQLARVTRSEMQPDTVSLTELARAIIADLQTDNKERNVAVRIDDDLLTQGDKHLLQIMLINLLGNAWKFTSRRERAQIAFGQSEKNGELCYFVSDNGAGFDMKYVNKLFGAFQRLHTASEFEGTGIGLATVQRIVHRHGGRVWAEGAVNHGATLYFTLANLKESANGIESDLPD